MLWDEIKPVNWSQKSGDLKFDPIDELLKNQLTGLSETRQNELEEFAFLKESIEFFKEKQELKAYSLNLVKRKEQKELDKEFRDLLETRQTELKKLNFISTEITLTEVEDAKKLEESKESAHEDNPQSTFSSPIGISESEKEFQTESGEIKDTFPGPEIAQNVETETPADESSEDSEEDSEEDGPHLDIHLRETLRILSDWIYAQDPEMKDTAANQSVADVKSKS